MSFLKSARTQAAKFRKRYTRFESLIDQLFRRWRRKETIMNAFRIMIASLALAALAACGGGGDAGGFASGPMPSTPTIPSAAQHPLAAPVISVEQAPAAAQAFVAQMQARAQKVPGKSAAAQTSEGVTCGGVPVRKAADQLFDAVAEGVYPQYFPEHRETADYEQFIYRGPYSTGVFVGVDRNTCEVNLLGGEFGGSIIPIGPLTKWYTPFNLYKDAIVALSDNGLWYPWKITITGGTVSGPVTATAEKAINATRFQTNLYPIWGCVFNTVKLSTGAIKVNCQETVDFVRHNLVWDLTTNRLTEYDGSEGAYPPLSDGTWVDTQPFKEGRYGYTNTSVGEVYTKDDDYTEIHFIRTSDGTNVILPISAGGVKALGAFTH